MGEENNSMHDHDHGHHHSQDEQQAELTEAGMGVHDMPMPMDHGMMYFHFGNEKYFLFNFWHPRSSLGILFCCLVVIASCFCLEFVRWYRVYRKRQFARELAGSTDFNNIQEHDFTRLRIASFVDAGLHALQLTISYMLMLVFMTFNVWLCVSIIFGEVMARLLAALFFPRLDLLVTLSSTATTEPCCG